jgi:hypothetical protein
VTTPAGKHERLIVHVPGDPERPFDETQIAAKVRRAVAPSIGERAADDLLRLSFTVLDGDEDALRALLAQIDRAASAAPASENPIRLGFTI